MKAKIVMVAFCLGALTLAQAKNIENGKIDSQTGGISNNPPREDPSREDENDFRSATQTGNPSDIAIYPHPGDETED